MNKAISLTSIERSSVDPSDYVVQCMHGLHISKINFPEVVFNLYMRIPLVMEEVYSKSGKICGFQATAVRVAGHTYYNNLQASLSKICKEDRYFDRSTKELLGGAENKFGYVSGILVLHKRFIGMTTSTLFDYHMYVFRITPDPYPHERFEYFKYYVKEKIFGGELSKIDLESFDETLLDITDAELESYYRS